MPRYEVLFWGRPRNSPGHPWSRITVKVEAPDPTAALLKCHEAFDQIHQYEVREVEVEPERRWPVEVEVKTEV